MDIKCTLQGKERMFSTLTAVFDYLTCLGFKGCHQWERILNIKGIYMKLVTEEGLFEEETNYKSKHGMYIRQKWSG